jgi:hypothetical protein
VRSMIPRRTPRLARKFNYVSVCGPAAIDAPAATTELPISCPGAIDFC